MKGSELKLTLPEWVVDFLEDRKASYPEIEDRMRLVIDLARKNIEIGIRVGQAMTGYPYP